MRILAFVDTHSDQKVLIRLAKLAKKGKAELLVCAGDISIFGTDLRQVVKSMDIGLPMLIVPGNHEDAADIDNATKGMKWVKNLHMQSTVVGDVLFLGCGGGGFSHELRDFTYVLRKFAEKIKAHEGKSIVVTHAPPFKTKLDFISGYSTGVKEMRKLASQAHPDYWICGHLHENEGRMDKIGSTVIINPGRKGLIIDI